jgi:carbamoylphosphate synthase small subunit
MKDRKLVLANGQVFKGRGESAQEVIGEVVFKDRKSVV